MTNIAFITGANKGIGFEIARQLARHQTHVIIGARDTERGKDAVARLEEEGIGAEFVQIDVTSEPSIRAAAKAVADHHPHLDILVNNAGVNVEFRRGIFSPSELSVDALSETYQTNVYGPLLTTQRFLPLLRKATAGRIVNVSSTLGSLWSQTDPRSPYYGISTLAYNSSKTVLNTITIAFARELKGTPIKINSACPGWVKTDLGTNAAPRTVEQGAAIAVRLATLPPDGPSGGFFDDAGVVAW